VNLQSDFVTAKNVCDNFFCDRTNVRSKLLLLGHLPNLIGHCPMSDSNLQPWKIEFKNCMVKLKFHEIQCQKPHLNCIGVGDTKIETCTCMNVENIEHDVAEFCYCFPPFMSLSQFRLCPMSLFYFLYVAISRHCRLLEFTLTGTLKRDCTIIVQS
jgi:hypothetical protein